MKRLLLVACLITVGGCVAPGIDYVRPQYSGTYGYDGPQDGYDDGGYYSGGYSDGVGGYYPDYYDGCCDPASVSIGFGYGYGYPGYYAWGGYPYGYYGYRGYYYVQNPHHHHGGNDGHSPPPRATSSGNNSWNDRDHGDDIHDRYHRYGEPTRATPWNAQNEAAIPESPRMAPAATQPGWTAMQPMPSPGFMPHGAPAAAHPMDFPNAAPTQAHPITARPRSPTSRKRIALKQVRPSWVIHGLRSTSHDSDQPAIRGALVPPSSHGFYARTSGGVKLRTPFCAICKAPFSSSPGARARQIDDPPANVV